MTCKECIYFNSEMPTRCLSDSYSVDSWYNTHNITDVGAELGCHDFILKRFYPEEGV